MKYANIPLGIIYTPVEIINPTATYIKRSPYKCKLNVYPNELIKYCQGYL